MRVQAAMENELKSITLQEVLADTRKYVQASMSSASS